MWTDTLQTTFMLASVIITAIFIKDELMMTTRTMFQSIAKSEYSQMIFTNWQDQRFYLKQFFSGAFIAIVMTGLDQDMMQKKLELPLT